MYVTEIERETDNNKESVVITQRVDDGVFLLLLLLLDRLVDEADLEVVIDSLDNRSGSMNITKTVAQEPIHHLKRKKVWRDVTSR